VTARLRTVPWIDEPEVLAGLRAITRAVVDPLVRHSDGRPCWPEIQNARAVTPECDVIVGRPGYRAPAEQRSCTRRCVPLYVWSGRGVLKRSTFGAPRASGRLLLDRTQLALEGRRRFGWGRRDLGWSGCRRRSAIRLKMVDEERCERGAAADWYEQRKRSPAHVRIAASDRGSGQAPERVGQSLRTGEDRCPEAEAADLGSDCDELGPQDI
jgi:hypothetical protein